MARKVLPKSKLDVWNTREETSLRKLAEDAFDQVELEALVDVDVSNPDDNDGLFYNLSLDLWENDTFKTINGESIRGFGNIPIPTFLTELSDISVSTPVAGEVLTYNGTNWTNAPASGGGASVLGDLGDVTIVSPQNGEVLEYNSTSGNWENVNAPWAESLNQLQDVTLSTLSNNDALQYSTSEGAWVNQPPVVGFQGVRNSQEERLLGWGSVVDSQGTGQLISLGTGFVWDFSQLNLSTNLQEWHGVATSAKQDTLVSGTNIKTINGSSVLGSGDLVVGGSLTHFTEDVNTTSPNNVVPVVSLTATNAATDVDVALRRKGNGALLVQVPDGTTTGGNKRGQNAVDFQVQRSAATQVALGLRSAILSGQNNTITSNGTGSAIVSGTSHTVSQPNAVVCGGNSNTASGVGAFLGGGTSNTASATDSGVVCGVSNQATAIRAFVGGGVQNQATGESSWVPGGVDGITRSIHSSYAIGATRRATLGDNQVMGLVVSASTTDATPTILTSNRLAASSTNVLVLPNNSIWAGIVTVIGRTSTGEKFYSRRDCVASRGSTAASTVLDWQLQDVTFSSGGMPGVSVTLVANTTRGSLEMQVTGAASTTIDWQAHFMWGSQVHR